MDNPREVQDRITGACYSEEVAIRRRRLSGLPPAASSSVHHRHNRSLVDNTSQGQTSQQVLDKTHQAMTRIQILRSTSFWDNIFTFMATCFTSLASGLRRHLASLQKYSGPALATAWSIMLGGFKLLRTAVVVATTTIYIIDIIRCGLRYCSLVTYSDNFEGDLISYLFQNSPAMLQRHREIVAINGRVLDMIQIEAAGLPLIERMIPIRLAVKSVYNTLSSLLVTDCTPDNVTPECALKRTGLIFKFSDAITKNIPSLAASSHTWPLISVTVAVYLAYSLFGMFVSATVTTFCVHNLTMRLLRYTVFVKRLVLIIANSVSLIA